MPSHAPEESVKDKEQQSFRRTRVRNRHHQSSAGQPSNPSQMRENPQMFEHHFLENIPVFLVPHGTIRSYDPTFEVSMSAPVYPLITESATVATYVMVNPQFFPFPTMAPHFYPYPTMATQPNPSDMQSPASNSTSQSPIVSAPAALRSDSSSTQSSTSHSTSQLPNQQPPKSMLMRKLKEQIQASMSQTSVPQPTTASTTVTQGRQSTIPTSLTQTSNDATISTTSRSNLPMTPSSTSHSTRSSQIPPLNTVPASSTQRRDQSKPQSSTQSVEAPKTSPLSLNKYFITCGHCCSAITVPCRLRDGKCRYGRRCGFLHQFCECKNPYCVMDHLGQKKYCTTCHKANPCVGLPKLH